jgi:hypothetical protein
MCRCYPRFSIIMHGNDNVKVLRKSILQTAVHPNTMYPPSLNYFNVPFSVWYISHLVLNYQYQNHTVWRCNIVTHSDVIQKADQHAAPTMLSYCESSCASVTYHKMTFTKIPTFMGACYLIPSTAWETFLLHAVGNTCVHYYR